MTALFFLFGVLFFVVAVAASIALHEIGHLVPAKRFGVKVTQYMVGFGPTLWSRQRGETEYGIKGIPLGGYIRMVGMFPPKPGERVQATSSGRLGMLVDQAVQARARRRGPGIVEQAREQSMEEIRAGEEHRAFFHLSVPRKVVVMSGGPLMNLLIAAVLLTLSMMVFGTQQTTTVLDRVDRCALPVTAPSGASCRPEYPAAPAAAAGLRPGDRITAVDGVRVPGWRDLQAAIRGSGGRQLRLEVVDPDGVPRRVEITPIVDERARLDGDGNPVLGPDGKVRTMPVGFLGISPRAALVPQPIGTVPGELWRLGRSTAGMVLRIPQKMVGVTQAAFGSGERDRNGPVSVVGIGRFGGEIASAKTDARYDVRAKAHDLLALVIGLNLALFVFNVIPLLPLDGGHIAGALFEGARRQLARLRRRPDPGPADTARMLPVAYAVSGLLVVMSTLLIYADLVKPIRLGG